jgi:hypothetical protein
MALRYYWVVSDYDWTWITSNLSVLEKGSLGQFNQIHPVAFSYCQSIEVICLIWKNVFKHFEKSWYKWKCWRTYIQTNRWTDASALKQLLCHTAGDLIKAWAKPINDVTQNMKFNIQSVILNVWSLIKFLKWFLKYPKNLQCISSIQWGKHHCIAIAHYFVLAYCIIPA